MLRMAFQVRTPVSRRAEVGASQDSVVEKQGNPAGSKKEISYGNWDSRQKPVKTYKAKGLENRAFSPSPRRIREKREESEWQKSKSRLKPQGEIVSILYRILGPYLCIYCTQRVYCSVFPLSSRWKIELCSPELLRKMAIKFPLEFALSPSFSFFLTKFELFELALWGVFRTFCFRRQRAAPHFRASHFCSAPSRTDGSPCKCSVPWVCQQFGELPFLSFFVRRKKI